MAIQISGTSVVDNSRNIVNPGYISVGNFTTPARDALSVPAGTLVYNSSTNKMQAWSGSSWIDLN